MTALDCGKSDKDLTESSLKNMFFYQTISSMVEYGKTIFEFKEISE